MQYLKDNVRQKIYNAAVAEFKASGYQDASIRNIAKNAGISLGNIYRYYENKEALYLAIVQPLMESVREFAKERYFAAGDDLHSVSEKLSDFMVEHDDEIVILRLGNTAHYKQFSKFMEDVTAQKIAAIVKDSNELIKNPDLSNIISRSFLHCLFDIIGSTNDKEKRKEYVEEVITFYFGHIDTRFKK